MVLTDMTTLCHAIVAGGGGVLVGCVVVTEALTAGSGRGKQVSLFKSNARQHVSFSL